MMTKEQFQTPDKRLTAVCGLFCPACGLFIGTQDDPQRLQNRAAKMQQPIEDLQCDGCRAERRSAYCRTCQFVSCAAEKGIDFCGQCDDYPCDELKQFQAARSHRIELWEAQERINAVGYEQWFSEMAEHYACPQCQTINSAYDVRCRRCGATPSCAYVGLHQAEITRYLSGQQG